MELNMDKIYNANENGPYIWNFLRKHVYYCILKIKYESNEQVQKWFCDAQIQAIN